MSAISSTTSAARLFGAQQKSSGASGRQNLPLELQEQLSSFLNSNGVSQEDQSAISKDLLSSLRKEVGNGAKPDFATLQSAVSSVLKEHGLDGDKFASQLIPPPKLGRGPGGADQPSTSGLLAPSNSPSASSSKQDTTQTLLEILDQSASRSRGRDGGSSPLPPPPSENSAQSSPYARLEQTAQARFTPNKLSLTV